MFRHNRSTENDNKDHLCSSCGTDSTSSAPVAATKAPASKASRRRSGRWVPLLLGIFAFLAAAAALTVFLIIPGIKYDTAEDLLAAQQYDEAIAIFDALGDFRDCPDRAADARYWRADGLLSAGQHEEAIAGFEALGDFRDCPVRAADARYLYADSLFSAGQHEDAIAGFEALGDYSDARDRITECRYLQAVVLADSGQHESAADLFETLDGYRDSAERAAYIRAALLLADGNYEDSVAIFETLGNYEDSAERAVYTRAEFLFNEGAYEDAAALFDSLGSYSDSTERAALCRELLMSVSDYDGSPVTLTFYHTMGYNLTTVLDSYIYEFNKLYPNITINHAAIGGYDDLRDQIVDELASGKHPNIAYCYPEHIAQYNEANAVAPLDSFLTSKLSLVRADGTTEIMGLTGAQKADFIPGFFEEGKQFQSGLLYSLPLSKSTEFLYYNKTFFDEHGLTVPTTWEEMEAVCAAIKAIAPDSIPLGYDSESNWFITMCAQYGSPYTSITGDHFLFDNETNRGFAKTFREWHEKGYLVTQSLYGAYTSGLFTSTTGTRCYMAIGSSAGAAFHRPAANPDGTYPFEVGIASIPQADPTDPKVTFRGPSLCIFKDENEQKIAASWLFIKYLTTCVKFQAEFSMASSYVPVLKSVTENPVYASFLNMADGGNYIYALSARVALAQHDSYFPLPAFVGADLAYNAVGELLATCLSEPDNGDPDGMIRNAFRDALDNCLNPPRAVEGA